MTMRARSGLLGNSVGGKPNSRPFRKQTKNTGKHAENAQKSVKGGIFCDFAVMGLWIFWRRCRWILERRMTWWALKRW